MAQMELIGQDNELADELARYCTVTAEEIRHTARRVFTKRRCSVLYYRSCSQPLP
jgi:hypothetical protein